MSAHSGTSQSAALRAGLAFAIGMGGAFAAWLWAIEVWQRPLWAIRIDEHWMPPAALAGFLAAALIWPGKLRSSWRLRLGMWLALGAAAFSLVPRIGRSTAGDALVQQLAVQTADPFVSTTSPSGFRWELYDFLDDFGVAGILLGSSDGPAIGVPFVHLLETSRWPVRRAWVERMLRGKSTANLLFDNWNHLLPPAIGQDVTLDNRRDLLIRLQNLAADPSLPAAGRDTATLWMGLLVLTDPIELADWRVPARDAMLAHPNPPMARTGDVWMRVLDVLLAFDPPDAAARLTAHLFENETLTRRALRERMRVIDAHLERIFQRIDALNEAAITQTTTAMVADLVQHLARHPDGPHAARMREWLDPILLRWLTEDSDRLLARRLEWMTNPPLAMSESSQDRLVLHAEALLERIAVQGDPADPRQGREVAHLMLLRFVIDDARRVAVTEKIGDLLTAALADDIPKTGGTIAQPAMQLRILAGIWENLTDERRHHLAALARARWADWITQRKDRDFDVALGLSHWLHPALGIKAEETLGLCFLLRGKLKPGGEWATHPWELPRFPKTAVRTYVEACVIADKSPHRSSFRLGDAGTLYFPPIMLRNMQIDSEQRIHTKLSLETLVILAMMDRGLANPESLGDDLLPMLHDAPSQITRLFALDDLTGMERVLDPGNDYQELRLILESLHTNLYPALPGILTRLSATQDANDVVIAHFLRITRSPNRSINHTDAYRVLLALEPHMPPDQQREIRDAFLAWIERERPPRNETHALGGHEMNRRITWPIHRHDDAPSARFSWQSEIRAETDSSPNPPMIPTHGASVFRHLTAAHQTEDSGYNPLMRSPIPLDHAVPAENRHSHPPEHPLEPTPWQRARDLHLRRPDLASPDRALFLPRR